MQFEIAESARQKDLDDIDSGADDDFEDIAMTDKSSPLRQTRKGPTGKSPSTSSPSVDVKTLRRERALLRKRLIESEEVQRQLMHELQVFRGKAATRRKKGDYSGSPDGIIERDVLALNEQLHTLEERTRDQKNHIINMENLERQNRQHLHELNSSLQSALKAIHERDDAIVDLNAELKTLKTQPSVKQLQEYMMENKRLKEELLITRGELLRGRTPAKTTTHSDAIEELGREYNRHGVPSPEVTQPYDDAKNAESSTFSPPPPPPPPIGFDEGSPPEDVQVYDTQYRQASPGERSEKSVTISEIGWSPQRVDRSRSPNQRGSLIGNAEHFSSVGIGHAHFNADLQCTISPVVEHRILALLHAKYCPGNATVVNHTRFSRFAREFGIVHANNTGSTTGFSGYASTPPYLVSGEVDIVYRNAVKLILPGDPSESLSHPKKAFFVQKAMPKLAPVGAYQTQAPSNSNAALVFSETHSTPGLTIGQFQWAIRQLGGKLYGSAVAKDLSVGAMLDCLPATQRLVAERNALTMFMQAKLVPIADHIEILPWGLMYLEGACLSIKNDGIAAKAIVSNANSLQEWYTNYCKERSTTPLIGRSSSTEITPSPTPDTFTQGCKQSMRYKQVSQFAHDFGLVPYLIQEADLYR
jgi:predicted kinase